MEKYFDKNGKQIKGGMTIKHDDGQEDYVYETVEGELGLNASNENFPGFDPLKREIYPLTEFRTSDEWVIVDEG